MSHPGRLVRAFQGGSLLWIVETAQWPTLAAVWILLAAPSQRHAGDRQKMLMTPFAFADEAAAYMMGNGPS